MARSLKLFFAMFFILLQLCPTNIKPNAASQSYLPANNDPEVFDYNPNNVYADKSYTLLNDEDNASDTIPPNVSVYIDGNKINFEVSPINKNNRILVPMRKIFETLGYQVNWIDKEKKVIATKGSSTITLQINNPKATVNKKQLELDVPAIILEGRTLVPLRFVGEGSDCDVLWAGEQNNVYIESRTSDYKVCEQISHSNMTSSSDWLFYTSNGTYKFKPDGSEVVKLLSNGTDSIHAIGNNLYGRLSLPGYTYDKLDLQTMEKTNVIDFDVGDGVVIDGWLYYDKLHDGPNNLYRMRLDGSNNTKVLNDRYSGFNIINNDIYTWDDSGIIRKPILGNDSVKISEDFINCAGVYNNELYFSAAEYLGEREGLRYKGIFKYSPADNTIIKLSEAKANTLRILNNSIYYTVRSEADYYNCSLHRLRIDGLFDIKLCDNIYSEISVLGNAIYFVEYGTDDLFRVYSDGSNKTNIQHYFDNASTSLSIH